MKWIAAAALAALLALLPAFAGDFYVNLGSQILIAAIFASSLAQRQQPDLSGVGSERACLSEQAGWERADGGSGQRDHGVPVGAGRQILRPDEVAVAGLAFRDNLKIRNDFPAQRERGSVAEFGPRGLAGPDHHRPTEKPVWHPDRQGIENDLKRGCVRHMPVTLTVDKFGLDSQLLSFGEKVHWARRLHATLGASRNSLNAGRG